MATSSIKARPKNLNYSEEAMQAACQAVLHERKGLREAARLHGVPPSTLKDRLKGRKPFHEVQRTVITGNEEERLVNWIRECARRGFGRTMIHVRQAVQSILNQRKAVTVFKDNLPGKTWVSLFLRRHKDVTLRTPQALGAQRAAVTESKLRGWFETALHEIQATGGDVLDHPSRIFNCDETGFQLGGGGFSKVLTNKGDRQVYQVSTDTHTQITVLVCGSASGDIHRPLIIFPGQRFSYDPLEGFPEAHFAKSNNGWIDGDIFTAWLKTAFIPAIEHLPKPVLLFADGHKTHLTLAVSELCRDHGIILYQLPSHSSHIVQPLDLITFKVLKQVWREEVLKYQEENCDIVGKREFSAVLKKAWERGIQKDTVISGFRGAGLYPWNPDHVDMTKLGSSRLYATATTETETDSVTVTVPSMNMTKPSEMTGLVPGTTENETLTVTMAADETMTNVHEDLLINSPSPTTYPSALPPLSLSPLPSCVTIASSSSLSDVTFTPIITAVSSSSSSSHITSTSTPVMTTAASSSSSLMDNTSTKEALDRLLDLTAKAGLDGLVRYRTLHTLGIETDDPEERLFCLLYSRLIRPPQTDNSGCVVEGRTFDNLPLPSRWTQKKRQTLQPPKMIRSEAFRQYVSDVDAKKRKIEEDKERKKKEREEKKKRTEEEKEKKNKNKKGKRRREKKRR